MFIFICAICRVCIWPDFILLAFMVHLKDVFFLEAEYVEETDSLSERHKIVLGKFIHIWRFIHTWIHSFTLEEFNIATYQKLEAFVLKSMAVSEVDAV